MSYVDTVETPAVPKPEQYYTAPSIAQITGLPVAYRREGSGEVVVFLHGAGYTRRWLPLYAMMAAGVDFVAPEAPGFGETPQPDWFRDFNDLVILYDQLLDEFDLDQVHLIGFSLGGWAAAEFASYYPRRLKSLTLITPIGLRLEDAPGVDMFLLEPPELMEHLFNDKSVMKEFLPDPDNFDEGVHLYSEMAAAARLIWAPRYNLALERRLQRLTCPSLIVQAEHDRLVPSAMAERFAAVLPRSQLEMIPGSGHEVCLERPRELADVLLRFVQESSQ